MSILNHFGKVKTSFVPYKSKYTAERKIYEPHQAVENGYCVRPWAIDYRTDNPQTEWTRVQIEVETVEVFDKLVYTANDGLHHQARRKYVLQDFADIIKKITDNFTSPIWATLNTSPLLTISELLWLKVDDIDSRVDHLEKMIAQVIDDNKLLQRKVDALEQQKRLRESRESKRRVLIEELD